MAVEWFLLTLAVLMGAASFAPVHVLQQLAIALRAGSAVALLMLVIAATVRHTEPVTPGMSEPPTQEVQVLNRPVEVHNHGYTGSDSCRSCHPHEYSTWHSTWHRTMTQVAGPDTVIGDFNDVTLNWLGQRFELTRQGDGFFVELEPPQDDLSNYRENLPRLNRPVVLTTGSHHMQVCWYAPEDNHSYLGMMPFTWLKEINRWVPRDAVFLKPTGANIEGQVGRWSASCIQCHTTHGRMAPAPGTFSLDTGHYSYRDIHPKVAEFGIACEACHGPGEAHVHRMTARSNNSDQYHNSGQADSIVNAAKLPHDRSTHVCGQCHGLFRPRSNDAMTQWAFHGRAYRPGDNIEQSPQRVVKRCSADQNGKPAEWENSFWKDGKIRVSGREFNGMIESGCFQRGEMSCLSCHQLHQSADDPRPVKQWADDLLAPGMRGNLACTQCHEEYAAEATLTAHTHHDSKSAGSNCLNCHMSYTTYGLLKGIRSHTIESPDVAVSLYAGRPNACNQCHLDRTLNWSANHLSEWYGRPAPDMSDDEKSIAASVIWALRGDAGQRALMAWSFGWSAAQRVSGVKWMIPYLAELMQDPYDAVRYIAGRSLKRIPGFEDLEYDFVGGPAHYEAVAREVVSSSFRGGTPARTERKTGDAPGSNVVLSSDVMSRLLGERDNTPMFLFE